MTESSFGGQLGTIYTRTWEVDGAHGAVVLVHGYGEHIGRYEHVAEALNDAGWSVHGLDHVGHGHSEGERVMIPTSARWSRTSTASCSRPGRPTPGPRWR
jgi:alpha-beta hydrolase superfamily lysophospholipase